MGWLKVNELRDGSYLKFNRRNRDRKGGHSPSMLFGDDGEVYVGPAARREAKRVRRKKVRQREGADIRALIQEIVEDAIQDAMETSWEEHEALMFEEEDRLDNLIGRDHDFDESPFEDDDDFEDWYDPYMNWAYDDY